jgi:hypothetical protein
MTFMGNPIFLLIRFHRSPFWRVTPTPPIGGRQPKGSTLLTPSFSEVFNRAGTDINQNESMNLSPEPKNTSEKITSD